MRPYKDIKVLFSDVDGTLTDGRLYYTELGETMKVFHVKDGHGIKNWEKAGNIFCVITARSSGIIEKRMGELGVKNVIMASKDKVADISRWLETNGLNWNQIAYIGDDINDKDALAKSAVSAAPADASQEVVKISSYVCKTAGGLGCVREFIDYLLTSK